MISIENSLKLLAGLPYYIDQIEVKPLTLREIASVVETEEKYGELLGILCISKKQISKIINNSDYDLDPFDYLYLYCYKKEYEEKNDEELNKYVDIIYKTLNVFLHDKYICTNSGCFICESQHEDYINTINMLTSFARNNNIVNEQDVYKLNPKDIKTYEDIMEKLKSFKIITKNNFDNIVKVIKDQNCIEEKEEETYNPANEKAREFIERFKKNKANAPKPKKEYGLYELISSVAWKTSIGQDVWNLTIYQLYDALARLNIIDEYKNTMFGIYTGNIDSKKINLKNINWFKKTQK